MQSAELSSVFSALADPTRRGLGFLLTVLPSFVLFTLGLIGALGMR